jgi:hypothetical protein
MTVGSQAFMLPEKTPDKIERRLPCSANLSNAHLASYSSERLRADRLG